ncbi:glycosyltransferase family 39 protein [bacterium]|nr:glycosyltransferase family 39 protein [bacterium]
MYRGRLARGFLLFLLYVAFSLLTRGPFIPVEILDMDEAAHAVGSWTWMNGGLLYEDFINNKPPLLYVYYAFAQLLFGKGLLAVHWMTALLVVPLTAFAVSAFFDHEGTGISAALLYLLYGASFLAHDMQSTNAEILMVLPGAWAVVVVRKAEMSHSEGRMFLAGMLFGIGFLFKYQIALGILAVGTAALRTGSPRPVMQAGSLRSLVYLLAGFLLPAVITVLIFYHAGGTESLFYWLFWNNLLYSANPISWWEGTGRAASYLLPFLLVTLPLWWFWLRSRKLFDDYRRALTTGLVLISIPPLFVGFRFYPHYFIQLYFPLIIAAAPGIVESVRRRAVVAYSVALCLICTAVNVYLYYGNNNVYRERDPIYHKVAERLKADPCYPGATLFVWGYAPAFYYYAGLDPASRFVVMGQARLTGYVSGNLGSLGRPSSAGVPLHWDWLLSDLQEKRATYVLDTAPAAIYRWNRFPMEEFPRLQNYIAENFERIDVVEDVVIYRRRQCSNRGS